MLDGTQNVGDGYIYIFEVDSDAGTLVLLNTTNAASAHPWLSFDSDRRVVYASGWSNPIASQRTYSAYSLLDDFTPRLLNTVPSCGTKPIANQFVGGLFYGLDFVDPCGDVWSVKGDGSFDKHVHGIQFEKGATLHGFANTPDLKYMYIMDLGGNLVHTFTMDPLKQINTTSPSVSGAGPRHAVIDLTANFLYLIDEEGLRVDQFNLDASTGALAFTNLSLAITPFGLTPSNASLYWGDEIALSSSGATLYASTRSRDDNSTGFIAAWALTATGDIVDPDGLFVVPTPAGGGTSNILTTSPWNDNMLILTDEDMGFAALYNLTNDGTKLVELSRVDISGTSCCAGSAWVD
ncbi:3-carboxy-cis cis-mucoante lactonizing enzyme [Lentinula aciculospora]|uniref:3-carboxy-cis cis-mucoante lactonizing enzyme n=1 Tax=Lentinula aciculospora TaxID=153920 RepID=A0A9W9DPU3_9AGAR|nr:3-carboxy-cis cis-mucoante lactonizing enzyme [Lentinula aciculospora]